MQISSVFTEQSRRYVKSMNPFTKERSDPLWWDNQVPQSCWAWSRQKYLWIVMTRPTKIFYCSNMENELKSCHNKTNWANFVWTQDFWILLKLDNTSWRKTLQNFHNFMQWPVVNTLFQEKKEHHNQKDGSFFFSDTDEEQCKISHTTSRKTRITSLPNDIVNRWCGSIETLPFQERLRKSPSTCARENHAPPPNPRHPGTGPENARHMARLGLHQLSKERLSLGRPPRPNLAGQNHQPGSSMFPWVLRVCSQYKPSTSQHPSLCATCSVAKDIEETATPAGTRGRREREPEAPKKQHTESRRINPRQGGCGEARERNTRQRASLRSEHRLFKGRESWPDTCRGTPGSLSTSTTIWCGRMPSANAAQLGASNPAASRCAPESRAPSKWNAGGSFRACTIRADTAGCLCWIIPKQSAQLDQKAGCDVKVSLRNPRPPNDRGRLARSQYTKLGSTPRSRLRHRRSEASWWAANVADNPGCTTRSV